MPEQKILLPEITVTGPGNGEPIIVPEGAIGLRAFLNVTAMSGSGPILIVTLRHVDSVDKLDHTGDSWQFTAVINTTGMQELTICPGIFGVVLGPYSQISDHIGRLIQVNYNMFGTSPESTFTVYGDFIYDDE